MVVKPIVGNLVVGREPDSLSLTVARRLDAKGGSVCRKLVDRNEVDGACRPAVHREDIDLTAVVTLAAFASFGGARRSSRFGI